MNIQDIKGNKYPDDYFIKYFFKSQLNLVHNQTFLEFGCANGCNLSLAYQYGNNVIGVDLNSDYIKYANYNFSNSQSDNAYQFINKDMREFCKDNTDINADALVFASSMYYIPKDDFIRLLRNIKKNKLVKKNASLFLRFREIDDFRINTGTKISENSYILNDGISGEDGIFCVFYETNEMIEILKKELNLRNFQTMRLKCDNIQNNTKITNSEGVIWGTIN
jgi:cyclopropane fatty-acyl-phospholipid synthase-like methyltransferase